jgi:hypothetical protein
MVKRPPIKGRFKGQRIVDGTLHNVIIEDGKIVEDFGPVKKNQYLEQEQPKIDETQNDTEKQSNIVEKPKVQEEKPSIGLTLISEDDSYIDLSRRHEEINDDIIIKPNSVSQEQKPNSGVHLVPVSLEDLGNILKQEKRDQTEPVPKQKSGKRPEWEDILSKIPEPDPDRQTSPDSKAVEQAKPEPIHESKKSHIPIIEPIKKPPQSPKITIPKVQINVPAKSEPAKLENVSNKAGGTLVNDTYPKPNKTKVVEPSLQKANENILTRQPVTTKEKLNEEKRKSMSDELDAELLDERKFEQWMKKQKFNENLEKAAQFAQQTKEQFEEKIPELSNRIEDITGEVKGVENKLGAFSSNVDNKLGTFSSNVDNRLGTVDKSIETLCTGIDCVKEDVKKYQTSHDALEKLVQERFKELGEKVQSLERPIFTCENCGESVIAPLSSYCPNCGSEIQSWSDEDGQPVRGWSPYWKRLGRSVSQ